MKMGHHGSIRRDLGRLFEGQSVAGLGEAQLLDRFVERRDEPAFAAIVARHGPMVLGVCQRLLADPHDVEDAFQATFLVLIRRAGSIRGRDRLAPWLFGVARKVATRTRTDLARRQSKECPGAEEIATSRDAVDPELNQALLDEIDRLPESLREPILLCCVEGLSYDEAATRMESTAPAVRGRLARARERLRDRLTRRGFAPSVVGVGRLFGEGTIPSVVPPKLLMMTTIPLSKAGAFPIGVEILAEGVIRTMIVTKSKLLFAALLTCGVAGTGVYAQKAGQETTQDRPASTGPAEPPKTYLSRTVMSSPRVEYSTDGGETWHQESPAEGEAKASTTRATGPANSNALPVANEPMKQDSDADRLGKLEKKLDRVLEALEGSFQPTRVQVAPPGQAIGRLPRPVRPGEAGSNLTAPSATRSADGRPLGVAARPQAPRFPQDATLESRVDFLEANIKHLNARIAELERNLERINAATRMVPDAEGSVTIPAPGQPSEVRSTSPFEVDPPTPAPPPTPVPPPAPGRS
jgi:RNA polymerase sigma factor (sigma-70 family)